MNCHFHYIADLAIRLDPLPTQSNQTDTYTYSRDDVIDINCRVGCQCGGTSAEWNQPDPLSEGLMVETSRLCRAQKLLTDGTGARLEHNGFYVCRVYNGQESLTKRVEIIVT